MKILLGIIFLFLLVVMRSKYKDPSTVPYVFTFVISFVMVVFVMYMMITLESPQP